VIDAHLDSPGPGGVLQDGTSRLSVGGQPAYHYLRATDMVLVEGDDLEAQVRESMPDGVDYAFDAIGRTHTTEQATRMLAIGGAAVLVGLPPEGTQAVFDPLAYPLATSTACGIGDRTPRQRR
jgi:Zn-dependent alcohol dehydrogenase